MKPNPILPAVLIALCALSPSPAAPGETPAEDPSPEQIVDSFHAALAAGDEGAALAHLHPDVVIFEGGGAEMSRDEYTHHHLEGDMKFSAAMEQETTDRRVKVEHPVAWVLSRTRTTGTWGDRELDLVGTETMVLRHTEEGWKIVHVHWSSRAKS